MNFYYFSMFMCGVFAVLGLIFHLVEPYINFRTEEKVVMLRDYRVTVEVPAEKIEELRLLVVTNGGKICKEEKLLSKESEDLSHSAVQIKNHKKGGR